MPDEKEPRYLLGVTVGYVTNSSSMVHHFPKELLSHPKIASFIKAFEVEEGFVGTDMWHRGACSTFAVTREQKQEVSTMLGSLDIGDFPVAIPAVEVNDDNTFVIVYGDEYDSLAHTLSNMLREICEGLKLPYDGVDFN